MDESKPSIFKLKKQYKRLFVISINQIDVIFRLLTWEEINIVRTLLTRDPLLDDQLYDDIFEECVVHSNVDDWDIIPAGYIPTVARIVIKMSMFNTQDEFLSLVKQTRDNMSFLNNQIESLLIAGMGIKKVDINNMILPEILENLVYVERILSDPPQIPAVPITIDDGKHKKDKTITISSKSLKDKKQ